MRGMYMKQTMSGILLVILLALPPVVQWMESIMIVHMLVQMPLLITAGFLIGKVFIQKWSSFLNIWNGNGIPGILVAVFITTYWMLPRTMDEALTIEYIEWFKFISLPITGFLIRDSWVKLQEIGKGFLYLNYLSMFALMAWLYIDAPIQVCNNYLEIEQKMLGWGLLFITFVMIVYIIQFVFTDHSEGA